MLQNNEKLCSKSLLDSIKNVPPALLEWVKSKDDFDVPLFKNIRLHSTYSVSKESAKHQSYVKSDGLIVAIDFACGYHLKSFKKTHQILAIIIDFSLFASIANKIDFSDFSNITFISINEIHLQIYQYLAKNPRSNVSIVISDYLNTSNKQLALELSTTVTNLINQSRTEINTITQFGLVWQNNINKNIFRYCNKMFDNSPLIIKNKIILVCGGGYSLTQNIDFIKSHLDIFYIAATDTASLILYKNQIFPDCIFSYDAQNISYQHFFSINNPPKPIRLFVDFTSGIFFHNKNVTTTLLFSNHPYRNIFKKSGLNLVNIDSGCGNIGWATVNFFKNYFQNIPLVTVGLDFGYYKHFSYARNSYLDDVKLTKQNYFQTANLIDSQIFYKNQIVKQVESWSTTSLLSSYATNSDNQIYTLSRSPFCGLNSISHNQILSIIIENEGELEFNYPQISLAEFNKIINDYLKIDSSPLIPFNMSKSYKK